MRATRRVLLVCGCLAAAGLAQGPGGPRPGPPQDTALAKRVADWVRATPPANAEQTHFGVLGGLNFLSIGPPNNDALRSLGPAAFYADRRLVEQAGQRIDIRAREIGPRLKAGGIPALRDVQDLPWGMVEIAPGQYDWTLADRIVNRAGEAGLMYVGTLMPFADWDQAGNGPAAERCRHFFAEDMPYLAHVGAMGRYRDEDAFIRWVSAVVERYDGDGVDDAPGLAGAVKYWQIHNEPEGPICGQFRRDPENFVRLMRRSYAAVHAADREAKVLNGGAGLVDARKPGGDFWDKYAAAGGANYVDIVAMHYNDGKVDGGDTERYESTLNRLRGLLGPTKPVWMTEFGVWLGEARDFKGSTEDEAAAWYLRFYAVGLANGVTRFFSDLPSFFRMRDIYLPYYVNKLMEAKLGRMSGAVKLGVGQYRFTVDERPVYVLWKGVPEELRGKVTATDMFGAERTVEATDLAPDAAAPLIVEPVAP